MGPSSNPNAPENINLIEINDDGSEIRHAWYQWVCMVLFIQAIFCYVPHYLWKAAEGGKLSLITQGKSGQVSNTGQRHTLTSFCMC